MKRVRVVVADDSLTVRRFLAELIAAQPDMEVVHEAAHGEDAADACARLRPDVVTLDMNMPVLDGATATRRIMSEAPTPILVVSASFERGDLYRTYDALSAGAVDVLEKPSSGLDLESWGPRFVRALRVVSRVSVVTRHGRSAAPPAARAGSAIDAPTDARAPSSGAPAKVIAIGASTGGPAALVTVLRAIPAPAPVPILVVLHIGAPFGATFASWLDEQTPHRVIVAPDGSPLVRHAGEVLFAPPDRHLVVVRGRVKQTDGPERHSCRPSVDVLFESLAADMGGAVAACLLTGMGRDGAAGLAQIRRAGGFTVAQDEASSVVFGMPREAIELGAAQQVLSIAEVGGALASAVRGRS